MPTADHDLIHDHLDLADHLARGYRRRGVDDDDLEQVARLALVKAARGYDRTRGAFAPYAAVTIRGEIKRWFRDHAWDVRPPRRIQELQAAIQARLDDDPRHDDLETVAADLDVAVADVREAAAVRGCYSCDSLEAAETSGHPFGRHDAGFEHVDQWETFCVLREGLDVDERRLLHWRYVDELTQQAIADRIGISQMQVSRRLAALLGRLRTAALDPAA